MPAELTFTGTLENLSPCPDGSIIATLAHPEMRMPVAFPAALTAEHHNLLSTGRKVTVSGDGSGPWLHAETVEVAY